jgi:predicted kinase
MQLANALEQQFVIGWGTQTHCIEALKLPKLRCFAKKYAVMRIVIFFDVPKIACGKR